MFKLKNLTTRINVNTNLINKKKKERINAYLKSKKRWLNDYNVGDATKNTVLLIEPRLIKDVIYTLNNAYKFLKDDWNYVFYCGNRSFSYWKKILPKFIEIRQLYVDNFPTPNLYSDFCKRKELWESLYGKYVLTIQSDSWIMSKEQYNINYFINLNKSYIGGNMTYTFDNFFRKENLHVPKIRNFNGGLSLRNRLDMINIINTFPPMHTVLVKNMLIVHRLSTYPEDVYFTIGCYKLGLPIGDDEASSHFAMHTINKIKYFGVHNPKKKFAKQINLEYPHLKYLNKHLNLN